MRFRYKARNQNGQPVEGYLDAPSADAVATELFAVGVTPIDIVEAPLRIDLPESFRHWGLRRQPALADLIMFCRQAYTLAKAGIPIMRAVSGLAETTRNPALADALRQVAASLESGRDLSSSLARHPKIFSPLVVNIVQVGENTGRLDQAFLQIAEYLELEKLTRERIKAALRYPLIVLVAIVVAIGVINLLVVPAFAKVFANLKLELPWATKVLIATSDFSVAYWPYALVAVGIAVYGMRAYIRTDKGRYAWDGLKFRLPLVGSIILRATLGRFARSFAMAARAGVPLLHSLTVVARAVDNEFIATRILAMRASLERGDTLTRAAAATGLFTPLILQMLAVGEETGAVDDLLQEVAEFYEREVDYDLKNLSAVVEPIMLVAVGVLVFILALGVFLPIWDLTRIAIR